MNESKELESEFLFHSDQFGIDPDEPGDASPYMFGKELAHWLAGKLKSAGYPLAHVVVDDWGWTIVVQRKPYQLLVACISALNQNLLDRVDGISPNAEILWRVIPGANQSFIGRLFTKVDPEPELAKLHGDMRRILESERGIRFASPETIESWETGVEEIIKDRLEQNPEPKPVSRWITLPVGVLMLPILLISVVGSASLLYDNPEGYEISRPIAGTILLLICGLLAMIAFRLITGKTGQHGGLLGPVALRVFAGMFFLLPIGGFFSGWYVEHPIAGPMQALSYYAISFSLWRLAAYRQSKLTVLDDTGAGERGGG